MQITDLQFISFILRPLETYGRHAVWSHFMFFNLGCFHWGEKIKTEFSFPV